jgi:hypothetical protein
MTRLKSHILAAAILRRAAGAGAPAQVVKKGDPDAGALFVKIFLGRIDGEARARLFARGPNQAGEPCWSEPLGGVESEARIDAVLDKERRFDRDLWIVEIEDQDGERFLEE